jgi:hypothetical protein
LAEGALFQPNEPHDKPEATFTTFGLNITIRLNPMTDSMTTTMVVIQVAIPEV